MVALAILVGLIIFVWGEDAEHQRLGFWIVLAGLAVMAVGLIMGVADK